jgi:excisionase family DNA binding protein
MVRMKDELTDGWDGVRKAYPPILTTAQVAEMLDLNVRTVLAMANDGRLPASRLADSRKYHFLLEDVIKTLQSNRVTEQQTQPVFDYE